MIPASESVKLLTSSLKGMKLPANEAISVVDKLTKLDMKSATSAQELAQALSKVANSARLAKVSQDEILGILSVGIETTQQSGDVIGTAVRSLLARFSNVKASKFSGSGEETEGTLNDTEAVLSKIGIRIRNASGEMRSFMDVLDDVAEKWDTLDDVSRNAISTAMAGTRQKEIFASIIENYDRVKELIGESANAAGTADEKYTAYMDSMEAATKRLQNAWEGFTQSLETSTVMKFLTNATALLVENADKLKYLVTYIAAAGSAKIFDFVTNKGETGGFKGLIANIPFIGRGTKTNNILENIDKKVGDIRGEVKKDKSGVTKNGGLISRLMSGRKQYKADEAFVKKDVMQAAAMAASKEAYLSQAKKVNALRVMSEGIGGPLSDFDEMQEAQIMQQQYEEEKKILQEKRQQYKAQEAISKTNKEEVKLAKARIAVQKKLSLDTFGQTATISGIATLATQLLTTKEVGAGIGGWAGKLITGNRGNQQTLEETAGDKALRTGFATAGSIAGAASAFIPVVGPAIAPIVSAIGSVVGEGIGGLLSTWFRADELAMKQRIADAKANLNALENLGGTLENIDLSEESSAENFADKIRDYFIDNPDFRDTFVKSLEESGVASGIKTITELTNTIKNNNISDNKKILQALKETQLKETITNKLASQEEERAKVRNLLYEDLSVFGIEGDTLEERRNSAELIAKNIKDALNDPDSGIIDRGYFENQLSAVEKYAELFNQAIDKLEVLNNEVLGDMAEYGMVKSGILDLSGYDLTDLGIEGAIRKIAEELQKSGYGVIDSENKINADIYEQILAKIKQSNIYKSLQYGTKTIGEMDLSSDKDVERLKQFAQAFGVTYEEALKLREEFGDLSTAMAYMTPQEVLDYYNNLTSIFNDLATNASLSADSINKILTDSNYQSLIPYLTQGADVLQSKLYERLLGSEQDLVYGKSLFSSLMSNTTIFEEFKNKLEDADLQRKISELGFTSFQSVITAVQEGTLNEDDEIVERAKNAIASWNVEYKKDLEGTNKLISYQNNLLDTQITNLNQQKEALSQMNNEREKELNLIKAKDALENARKEKKRVYRAGVGFVMQSNEEAIAEAQKNLENLNTQKRQESLQMQIDALQMQKDILENLPKEEEMEQLSKIYSQWAGSGEGSMKSVTDATVALVGKYKDATAQLDTYTEFLKSLQTPPSPPEDDGKGGGTTDITSGGKVVKTTSGGVGRGFGDTGNDDIDVWFNGQKYQVKTSDWKSYSGDKSKQNEITEAFKKAVRDEAGNSRDAENGEVFSYNGKYYVYHSGKKTPWEVILDNEKDAAGLIAALKEAGYAKGAVSFSGGSALINELGTEAVITPGGTLTALPSKTGIVPADITRNVWALGEVAPTLVAQLGSLTQKTLSGNAGNTTYEEGQYFDNFTMNVYPAKGDDLSKILEQARAQMRLTRHNN